MSCFYVTILRLFIVYKIQFCIYFYKNSNIAQFPYNVTGSSRQLAPSEIIDDFCLFLFVFFQKLRLRNFSHAEQIGKKH